jgi:hypothetical protein
MSETKGHSSSANPSLAFLSIQFPVCQSSSPPLSLAH